MRNRRLGAPCVKLTRVARNGLIVGHYERGGEIKIGDTVVDSPSDREVARRERMKRENESTSRALHAQPR